MKQSKLYDIGYCDLTKNRMFDDIHRCKNTQRYDIQRYKFFDEHNDTMLGAFWRPDEVSMTKDKSDYESNSFNYERFILTEQFKKLSMLDSLQGRSPAFTFGQLTTNPELEGAILTWDFFEMIHSRSYSHIIQSVYPDPSIVFDETFDNELLMKHTKTIVREYEVLYREVLKYNLGLRELDEELKEMIVLALASVNILEGVRFYSGFASIWSLKEFRGIFPGSSKILQFIAKDENYHLTLTQNMLRRLKNDPEEGFQEAFKKMEPKIYDMYFEASEEEFEWIDYLYQHGHPLGINENIAKAYIKYVTNLRLRNIGLKIIYPGETKNPITWINKYLSMDASETALQEIENSEYKQGGIEMEHISGEDFKNLYQSL